MTINIVAIATGAFMGLLGLVAIVACVPPITRFLGDLLCCPWRLPFTKKKRANEDEDVDSDQLPYTTGEPRPGTPVDNDGYQRTSMAYMSVCNFFLSLSLFFLLNISSYTNIVSSTKAVSVVDPETAAMEEMRRSSDIRRSYQSASRYDIVPYDHRDQSPPRVSEHHHMMADHSSGAHLDVPQPYSSPSRGPWRGPSPASSHASLARSNNYPPSVSQNQNHPYRRQQDVEGYASDAYSYSSGDLGVATGRPLPQLPLPSHSAQGPEMSMHQGAGGLAPYNQQQSVTGVYGPPLRGSSSNISSPSHVGGSPPSQWTNV